MKAASDSPGPIERYLQILEVVAASTRGLTLTEIAGLTGLPKPTAHRLTRSLVEAGALATDDTWYKTFRIGARMWRMLKLGMNPEVAAGYAQIVVDELAAELGETCYVVRLGQARIFSIARNAPDQGHRLHVLPGDELPPHAAASAKAILAFQPEDVVARFLKEPLERLTGHTLTDPRRVREELAEVRRQDFAVCDREIDDNIMAYAAPIHMEAAGVIYALGVTGPCTRLRQHPRESYAEALHEAAARLAKMFDTFPDPLEAPGELRTMRSAASG
ncbi:IclR family transcriptional regulator [Afifella pfennigii]|uniref:IclR family transcriptional regulator n=1 Tax=Afifella pfennigii TaxID=209897 RepID=UPI00146F9F2B|nr:IclR family transcriptional regulator [Afifella pfennigii]